MLKHKLRWLIVNFLGAILLIAGLYAFSIKSNRDDNAFIRHFPPHFIKNTRILDLQYNSYYIAGLTETHIFLGNYTVPNEFIVTTYDLKDTQTVNLNLSENKINRLASFKLFIDSPNIYLVNGLTSIIYAKKISSHYWNSHKIDNAKFSLCLPFSLSSVVTRQYDTNIKSSILIKQYLDSGKLKPSSFVLQKQGEGFFSTDGMLLYNHDFAYIIYIYYYRNQINFLDSNLAFLAKL